ncbi:MAG: hypothetical protein HDR97_01695 [Bacteroides sp.]|nr:hypothetical protein [Bacteroides sp.]MBD5332452.1 hypothetical protein [Bacteroides sp.]
MELRLDEAQMLELWRQRQGILPLRDDIEVVRTDGLDFSGRLKAEMDGWYLNLLATAPEELLVAEDCRDVQVNRNGGVMTVSLPEGVMRIVGVRLSCWGRSGVVVDDPDSVLARRQLCGLTRACREAPVAVWDRQAGELRLYPAAEDDRLERLDLVVRREGVYAFDRAALQISSID